MRCVQLERWAAIPAAMAGLLSLATGASAAPIPVDVKLVLAVDISRSMDMEEQRVQRQGYVDAFRNADVINAITDGEFGRIAVTYIEWSNQGAQLQITPWTLIDSKESSLAFANTLEEEQIHVLQSTSISGALTFSAKLLAQGDFEGTRRTIDISGDGPNNDGAPVMMARQAVLAQGITINGLPIMIQGHDTSGTPDLDKYYKDCVVGGEASFLLTIHTLEEFPVMIRRKLVQEVSGPGPYDAKVIPAQAEETDCMLGERRRPQGFIP